METLVTDLEYADDMALVSSSWSDLEAMIVSLNRQCTDMGLTISCKKTKTLAVLHAFPSCQQPEPILLSPDADHVEPVPTFQYPGIKHSITGLQLWCIWDNKHNTSIRKTARQQRVSTLLSQRRLQYAGHLARMDDSCLPRKLMVSALSSGKHSTGGQKCRWNDLHA